MSFLSTSPTPGRAFSSTTIAQLASSSMDSIHKPGHKRSPSSGSGATISTSSVGGSSPNSSPQGTMSATELEKLRTQFKSASSGVPLKPRVVHQKLHKNVFLGKDAVEWLMKHGSFKSREEAVAVAQSWLTAGDFQHTEGNHSLEDGNFYYEFKGKSEVSMRNISQTPPKKEMIQPIVITTPDEIRRLVLCQSKIRVWLAKRKYNKMKHGRKRRNEIAQEVIVTEKSYLARLRVLLDTYMRPIRTSIANANEVNPAILSESNFKIIFFEIDIIVFYNTSFLEALEKRMRGWNPAKSRLGDVFLMLGDFIQVYVRYIKNYKNAIMTVRSQTTDNKGFANFLNGRKNLPQVVKMELEEFLTLPLQRIQTYVLMIEELLQYSIIGEEDFRDLSLARERLTECVNAKSDFVGSETYSKVDQPESGSFLAEPKKKLLNAVKGVTKSGKTGTASSTFNLGTIGLSTFSSTFGAFPKEEKAVLKTIEKQIFQRDEDLWNVMTLVLNAMQIRESEDIISDTIQSSIEAPPDHLRTIQMMGKIYKKTKKFLETNRKEASIIKIQALARERRARQQYKQLKTKYGNSLSVRNKAFRDLLYSERNYVEQLNTIVQSYLLTLREMLRKKLLSISHADLASLFSNVETILEFHEQLLTQMESIFTHWPSMDTIGALFVKMIPQMKPYTEYVKNFKCAGDTLMRCQLENEKFVTFMQEVGQQTKSGNNLYILLSAPLHRVQVFKAAIDTLISSTLATHPDHTNLLTAQTLINQLTEDVEKASAQAKNYADLFNVKRRIDITDQKVFALFEGKRKFLREGPASIIDGKTKEKRYLFVFNDACLITKPNPKTNGKTYLYVKLLSLNEPGLNVEGIADSTWTKNAFKLKLQDYSEVTFIMKSQFEKEEWMREFSKLIAANARKRSKKDVKDATKKKDKKTKRDSSGSSPNSSPSETLGFAKGETVAVAQLKEKLARHSLEIKDDLKEQVKEAVLASKAADPKPEVKLPEVVIQDTSVTEKIDKALMPPPVSPKKEEPASTASPKKSIGGILARMKDRKKEPASPSEASKKYLTWGPTSEGVAAPVSKEDAYLSSLKSLIDEPDEESKTPPKPATPIKPKLGLGASVDDALSKWSSKDDDFSDDFVVENLNLQQLQRKFVPAVKPTDDSKSIKRTVSNSDMPSTRLSSARDDKTKSTN